MFLWSRVFSCIQIFPLLVTMGLGRCFVTRYSVIPDKAVTYKLLMYQRKVEGKGLHAVECKNVARSSLVEFDYRAQQESGW